MEVIGAILFLIGAIISFVGGIWFLIVAFGEGILWGLACLFIPFVSLIFLAAHWDHAKKPFGISVLGTLIAAVGGLMAPGLIE